MFKSCHDMPVIIRAVFKTCDKAVLRWEYMHGTDLGFHSVVDNYKGNNFFLWNFRCCLLIGLIAIIMSFFYCGCNYYLSTQLLFALHHRVKVPIWPIQSRKDCKLNAYELKVLIWPFFLCKSCTKVYVFDEDSVFLKDWDQEAGFKSYHEKLSEDLNSFNLSSIESSRQQN
jgi:hypothetical protein